MVGQYVNCNIYCSVYVGWWGGLPCGVLNHDEQTDHGVVYLRVWDCSTAPCKMLCRIQISIQDTMGCSYMYKKILDILIKSYDRYCSVYCSTQDLARGLVWQ